MNMFDIRRRMMLASDKRFYIFKEGEGAMNGFTASSYNGTVDASGMYLTRTTSSARAEIRIVSSGALDVDEWANFSKICFEVEATSGTFNVGYKTYKNSNVPLYEKYQRNSNTERTIIEFPVYSLQELKNAYNSATGYGTSTASVYIGIFNSSKSTDAAGNSYDAASGTGACYNIWLE